MMEVTRMIVSSVCCVVLIVGVVSASSRLVTNTEHGRSQQRPASRFITVKRNTGAYDDDKKGKTSFKNVSFAIFLKKRSHLID